MKVKIDTGQEIETPDVLSDHVTENWEHYASGVLKPDIHYRLVQNINHFAAAAGITPEDVSVPFSTVVTTEDEYEFVRKFSTVSDSGFAYIGRFSPDVSRRMSVITGAFLRNFITARMIPAELLIRDIFEGERPEESVLLIPDFAPKGAKINAVRKQMLHTVLLDRVQTGKKTFIGVSSEQALSDGYGGDVLDLIKGKFTGLAGQQ